MACGKEDARRAFTNVHCLAIKTSAGFWCNSVYLIAYLIADELIYFYSAMYFVRMLLWDQRLPQCLQWVLCCSLPVQPGRIKMMHAQSDKTACKDSEGTFRAPQPEVQGLP